MGAEARHPDTETNNLAKRYCDLVTNQDICVLDTTTLMRPWQERGADEYRDQLLLTAPASAPSANATSPHHKQKSVEAADLRERREKSWKTNLTSIATGVTRLMQPHLVRRDDLFPGKTVSICSSPKPSCDLGRATPSELRRWTQETQTERSRARSSLI